MIDYYQSVSPFSLSGQADFTFFAAEIEDPVTLLIMLNNVLILIRKQQKVLANIRGSLLTANKVN